jgi:ubiquinone/menaquinone biosynthesis C-methylase UbiE
MASGLAGQPGATFVGVDRSPVQIAEARRIAREAALGNVQFALGDFEGLDLPAAAFDYVVAHGVCSWVPLPARRALLRATARALAPGGVAYVSFNVLPGWYERLAARDWLRFDGAADAAASLRWLRDQVSPELAAYRAQLAQVARRLGETDPAYATHEYGAAEHHPQTVGDLLAEAAEAGLEYLGDAIPGETSLELLPEAVRARARGFEAARAQQLVDFARNTAFRRALLVGRDDARTRGWRWPARLDVRALESLRVSSRLRPVPGSAAVSGGGPETFETEGLRVQVVHAATCRALRELTACAPRSMAFGDLARGEGPGARDALRDEVFDLWLATGAVDLHTFEPTIGDASASRPRACPVARWHALHGGTITNLRHQEVRLPESPLVSLLGCLDGASDVAQLRRRLREALSPAPVTDAELEMLVSAGLDRLAAAALLIA